MSDNDFVLSYYMLLKLPVNLNCKLTSIKRPDWVQKKTQEKFVFKGDKIRRLPLLTSFSEYWFLGCPWRPESLTLDKYADQESQRESRIAIFFELVM